MTTYFAFALADSMFTGAVTIVRREVTPEMARALVADGAVSALNPAHTATVEAMRRRYGIDIDVPDVPPSVRLAIGDRLLVMAVRGLPRLTDRRHYTEEEIAAAGFVFSLYDVVGPAQVS